MFRLIWELEAEVNNGGFDQFFFNSSGDIASLTPWALRIIGAGETCKLVEQASAVFGGDIPAEQTARWAKIRSFTTDPSVEWNRLDELFYQFPDDLESLLFAYVETHRESFSPSS